MLVLWAQAVPLSRARSFSAQHEAHVATAKLAKCKSYHYAHASNTAAAAVIATADSNAIGDVEALAGTEVCCHCAGGSKALPPPFRLAWQHLWVAGDGEKSVRLVLIDRTLLCASVLSAKQ